MDNLISLKLTSNDGKKYQNDEVLEVYFKIYGYGEQGILVNSAAVASKLDISTLRIKTKKGILNIAISGGLLSFKDNELIILASTYELDSEIDQERALKAKEKAENILKSREIDKQELFKAEIKLKKAINRLSLIK